MLGKKSKSNYHIVAVLVLLVLSASSRSFASQREEWPRGEVIASVACKADPQQSYATIFRRATPPMRSG
ncbi:MAG: hypothetical protein ABR557_07565, partial [Pyrinomonadaceae bacterium]